jgi:hypothetical protein
MTSVATNLLNLPDLLRNPELFMVTSRFLDIAISTLNRLPPEQKTEELLDLEYELFRLSRTIPAGDRKAAWQTPTR